VSLETIYDEQVNPLMAQIIAICKEHKINAHATFFLDGDLLCSTHLKLDGDPLALELMYLAAYCRNNIDLLFITLARYVREGRFTNGGSAVLSVMLNNDAELSRLRAELAAAKQGAEKAERELAEVRRELGEAQDRLSRATHFAHGDAYVIRCEGHRLPKSPMWKVERFGFTLAKDGSWECEPIPSSRDAEYYQRCRFDSYEDAVASLDSARRAGQGERGDA
jgi:hypothetical protein